EGDMAIDWNLVIFNMLTIKGIYGREMYETWYQMTVMLQSGLDIRPVITHRYHYTEYEEAFRQMLTGHTGKGILDWSQAGSNPFHFPATLRLSGAEARIAATKLAELAEWIACGCRMEGTA